MKNNLRDDQIKWFSWIRDCCDELNWETLDGGKLIDDISWFNCYDEGMTPKEAVEEAISKGIVEKRNY